MIMYFNFDFLKKYIKAIKDTLSGSSNRTLRLEHELLTKQKLILEDLISQSVEMGKILPLLRESVRIAREDADDQKRRKENASHYASRLMKKIDRLEKELAAMKAKQSESV